MQSGDQRSSAISHAYSVIFSTPFFIRVVLSCVLLLGGSLVGCHTVGYGAAATPVPEKLLVEGTIQRWEGAAHAYIPVTIHGKSMLMMIDLGGPVELNYAMITSSATEFGIPSSDVTEVDGRGLRMLDSLMIGTAVERNVSIYDAPAEAGPSGYVGLIGATRMSHYDLAFDGPAHRIRVYEPSSATSQQHPVWLPPGITPADCQPILPIKMRRPKGDRTDLLVGLLIRVNGHPMHSLFDSGADQTVMDTLAAKQLKIPLVEPNVHLFPPDSFMSYGGWGILRTWSIHGLSMAVANHQLSDHTVMMVDTIPSLEPGSLDVGLDAFHDRVIFVSYSSHQVCVGAAQ